VSVERRSYGDGVADPLDCIDVLDVGNIGDTFFKTIGLLFIG
jgi:hypothetical protein